MGEDGNRMIDREALAAALAIEDKYDGLNVPRGQSFQLLVDAARERLAQLPEVSQMPGFEPARMYLPALVERMETAVGFALMDSGLEVNGRWSKEKSHQFAVAVLDALNTDTP